MIEQPRALLHTADTPQGDPPPPMRPHHAAIGSLASPSHSSRRRRVTVFLPASLLERLRNAVYWTERRPLARIIEDAVEEAVSELEQAHGGAFPTRLAPLKPGRPARARPSKTAASTLTIAAARS